MRVGVDIACRMRMCVFDLADAEQALASTRVRDRLRAALASETRFGVGAQFNGKLRRDHPVLDEDWTVTPVTTKLSDHAWTQLGTCGSGNHFVEFGMLTLARPADRLRAGRVPRPAVAQRQPRHRRDRGLALLEARHGSPSGLPKELRASGVARPRPSEAGQEYWDAMNLMGEYAAANHDAIHHHVAKALGSEVLAVVENHHNFAWKEMHDGRS